MSDHDHYFFDIPPGVTRVDIYRLIEIIGITCPVAQHVFKKAAVAGRRGHKDLRLDWENIQDSAKRKLVMMDEDDRGDRVARVVNKLVGAPEPPTEYKQVILEGHEVDTDFDTEKARMPAIGTNGNDGGHYAPTLLAGYSWADAPPDATVLVMATMTGVYHWADAFSNGARIYGAQFERMGLTSYSGWKLIARRPGSDPGWVVTSGRRPDLPWDMLVEVAYQGGARHRLVVDNVEWAGVAAYRVIEALEQ